MDNATKILIIDDHPLFLEGLSHVLQSIMPSAEILSALNGADALEVLQQHLDIDWILLDLNLPDYNGLDLIDRFTKNKILANVIIVTSATEPEIIDQSLKRQVNGFLTKNFDRWVLMECFKKIDEGGVFLTSEHANQLSNYRETLLKEKQLIEQLLSSRQKETLILIAKGYSNQEIADNLGIAISTVKTHVSTVISLFEAENRTRCVAEARRLHII